MQTTFGAADAAIILVYLASLAGVGVYFSRRQTSLAEFFVASRSMSWFPVGLSLMAALNSGIDYLMQPSATIRYRLVLLAGTSSWLFLYPWVSRVTLPFYRRLKSYTAYEFLEARFDVRVRALAATIFVVWRLGWMATAIYVPCLAVSAMTGGRVDLRLLIIGIGVLVTLYTTLGGIQAVIWNDVIQFCVMFSGLGATVWIALANVPGGAAEIWQAALQAGADAPVVASGGPGGFLRVLFFQPINLWALVITMILGRMASYTSDQVMVQRMQTVRSLGEARRAYVINAAGDVLWMCGLSLVGLALLAFFGHHALPPEYATDKILPYFMSQTFPTGAVGLVVAAILAASLSSIDSAVNACTSVIVVDLYNRFSRGPTADQRRQVRVSRVATVGLGLTATVLAMNVARIGTLLEIANKLINAFSGPLFGLYVVALFARRATATGALAGGIAGSLVSYTVAYHTSISFLWPSAFGLAATLVTSAVVSALVPVSPQTLAAGQRLTWAAVMREPQAEGVA